MRQSRKKITLEQIPLFTVTEKLRQKAHSKSFRRECCQKENDHCKDVRHSKGKDCASSARKSSKKKKFLEQELQKLLQKRSFNEELKMNEMHLRNASDFQGLRDELKEMKDYISKLSLQDGHPKDASRQQIQVICIEYRKKIEELSTALDIQKQINFKLEDARSRSDTLLKQTKDYSDSLNRQFAEFASIHVSCEQNSSLLAAQNETIQVLKNELILVKNQLTSCLHEKDQLNQEFTLVKDGLNKAKEENTTLFNENRQLQQSLKALEDELKRNIEQLDLISSDKTQADQDNSQKLRTIQKQRVQLEEQKNVIQAQLNRLQTQFNQTRQNLGNTEQKLKGLVSMQKKCQELFDEIKQEKQRWDSFNMQAIQEKAMFQVQLQRLKAEKKNMNSRLDSMEEEKKEALILIEQLNVEIKKTCGDKSKLETKIKKLQENIQLVEEQKFLLSQELTEINSKLAHCETSIQLKQSQWNKEKNIFQSKIQWLEKQKEDIEKQVKGTLEVARKRNDEVMGVNIALRTQINKIKEEKVSIEASLKTVQSQYSASVKQCEMFKAAVGEKEQKIIQLDNQQYQLRKRLDQRRRQIEARERAANSQWNEKYQSITQKLDSCLSELRQCKRQKQELESELSQRQERIVGMSTIRQNLQQRLQEAESRLSQSETARFSLSAEIQEYQLMTKRNEDNLREEKHMHQNQLAKKNKVIYELKETIKLIKEESFKIQEEVQSFRNVEEFQEMVSSQMQFITSTIKFLAKQKDELELQLNILKAENNKMSNKIFELEQGYEIFAKQNSFYLSIQQENNVLKKNLSLLDASKSKQIQQLQEKLSLEAKTYSEKLNASQTSIRQFQEAVSKSNSDSSHLLTTLKYKDKTIQELNQKIKLFEQKKRKVMNDVHSIQNQISELALKNSIQEEELKSKDDRIITMAQKIKILNDSNSTLEEQNTALLEQSMMLKQELGKQKEEQRQKHQKAQSDINEVYEICEARKGQVVSQLKKKIEELAGQLTSCINKFNSKNKQFEALQGKYVKLQQTLQENQNLIQQEKSKRQEITAINNQLNTKIQTLKCQVSSNERDMQTLNRDKTILRERSVQIESKYQILKRKYDHLHQQKMLFERQVQNQNITLRVLKQQNKNIQKVMSEQINQRKIIIQQLVNEKKMLYAQLHHQR